MTPTATRGAPFPPYAEQRAGACPQLARSQPGGRGRRAGRVLLAFSLSTLTGSESHAGVAGVVFSVLLIAPLVLRRRAPVAVFAAVMVVCAAQLPLVESSSPRTSRRWWRSTRSSSTHRAAWPRSASRSCSPGPRRTRRCSTTRPQRRVRAWLALAGQITLAAALGDRTRARLRERARLEERALLAAERDQQATIAAAAERARIARELHDVVAHSLSVVIAQADGGRYAAGEDPSRRPPRWTRSRGPRARRRPRCAARSASCASSRARRWSRSPASASCRPWSRARATPGSRSSSTAEGVARDAPAGGRRDALPGRPGGAHERAQARGPGVTATVTLRWEPDRGDARRPRRRRRLRPPPTTAAAPVSSGCASASSRAAARSARRRTRTAGSRCAAAISPDAAATVSARDPGLPRRRPVAGARRASSW